MNSLTSQDIKSYVKNEITKNIKKLRGKHPPISELNQKVPRILKVEKLYDLKKNFKNFYLFIVRNYSKTPKLRYFLAISLANNSSDFLVQIARDFATQNGLKLIQYPIFPKMLRIQLLLLKEIKKCEDYNNSLEKLTLIRRKFRIKLDKIKNTVENE